MDILSDLGALAFGSRLKRLSDQLMQDGIRVYRDSGLPFEPKWFPVFYYLGKKGPSAVFTDRDISNTAAISRDIKSILKRDSKVMVDSGVNDGPALSIAGGNIRSNSLTVDGVKQNDWRPFNKKLWQFQYHDRIIRDKNALEAIRQYISNHPN